MCEGSWDEMGESRDRETRFSSEMPRCALQPGAGSVSFWEVRTDASSSAVVVHAVSLVQTSTNASEVIQASGSANPDNDFGFGPILGPTGGLHLQSEHERTDNRVLQTDFHSERGLIASRLDFPSHMKAWASSLVKKRPGVILIRTLCVFEESGDDKR